MKICADYVTVDNAVASPAANNAGGLEFELLAVFCQGVMKKDRMADLAAYAMTASHALPAPPGGVHHREHYETGELADFVLGQVCTRILKIRQPAVLDRLGQLPRPAWFLRILAAELVTVARGGRVAWLALIPKVSAGLAGLRPG